jgi:hypothetical protein
MTSICGMRNRAGTRPPSSRGENGSVPVIADDVARHFETLLQAGKYRPPGDPARDARRRADSRKLRKQLAAQ